MENGKIAVPSEGAGGLDDRRAAHLAAMTGDSMQIE